MNGNLRSAPGLVAQPATHNLIDGCNFPVLILRLSLINEINFIRVQIFEP
jgi:hypothetical protein